jgi:GNAT superfamily N-acetyltransferase
MLTLRAARVSEAEELTELCLRSKAVWGYDAAFMAACRDELAITPAKIEASRIQVAELDGILAGVARLIVGNGDAELAALFVEPAIQRAGVGHALFDWAVAECRVHNVAAMTIEADPGAAPFYRRMGARDAGTVPSGSIPGRMLPKLEFVLTSAA